MKEAADLVYHYPYRYDHFEMVPFSQWKEGDQVVISGPLMQPVHTVRFGGKRTLSKLDLFYDSQTIRVSAFNQPWLGRWQPESIVTVVGRYEGKRNVNATKITQKDPSEILGVHPVYSLRDLMSDADFQKLVLKCFEANPRENFEEFVPEEFKTRYRLMNDYDALKALHFPRSEEEIKAAQRTLKYEEFLRFEVVMEARRTLLTKGPGGVAKTADELLLKEKIDSLPFKLTEDQNTALQEILGDMKKEARMYRLLEGEVGSGKTAVAALAMYAAITAGYQACLLAPTEILARQHAETLKKLIDDDEVSGGLLFSGVDKVQKEMVLTGLKSGSLDYVTGTHSLFQDDVEFKRLGLVIIDEQQRFGVEQRAKMNQKGADADLLMMTATPIPRTLASAVFGDMDVSIISRMPSGRLPVITRYIPANSILPIKKQLEKRMSEGDQVFMVCPSIDQSETRNIRNVNGLYENLKKEWAGRFEVAFVHGRMGSEEKDQVMRDFREGKYQALVTTTVVEVGVDIPHANIMVIYDAQCFGLSQIHQLRGRVGRAGGQGYCYLLSGDKSEDVKERLTYLAQNSDGFKIAEYDLKRRGPGDMLGSRQSGAPGFILGNLIDDQPILIQAQKDARKILADLDHYPGILEYLKNDGSRYLESLG